MTYVLELVEVDLAVAVGVDARDDRDAVLEVHLGAEGLAEGQLQFVGVEAAGVIRVVGVEDGLE